MLNNFYQKCLFIFSSYVNGKQIDCNASKNDEAKSDKTLKTSKCRLKHQKENDAAKEKLLKENLYLLSELDQLKTEHKALADKTLQLESIMGISPKILPPHLAKLKLEKACAVRIN